MTRYSVRDIDHPGVVFPEGRSGESRRRVLVLSTEKYTENGGGLLLAIRCTGGQFSNGVLADQYMGNFLKEMGVNRAGGVSGRKIRAYFRGEQDVLVAVSTPQEKT